jgi:RHS repeat-associated protein
MSDGQQTKISRRTLLLTTDSSQSTICEIVDGKINTIAYTAYGEQSALQEVESRLGFNGQVREMTTHWYLLGNGYRAYNPRLMRFHSPDSWSPFGGGGLNSYMYCGGEPVMNSDSSGHFFGFLDDVFKLATARLNQPLKALPTNTRTLFAPSNTALKASQNASAPSLNKAATGLHTAPSSALKTTIASVKTGASITTNIIKTLNYNVQLAASAGINPATSIIKSLKNQTLLLDAVGTAPLKASEIRAVMPVTLKMDRPPSPPPRPISTTISRPRGDSEKGR